MPITAASCTGEVHKVLSLGKRPYRAGDDLEFFTPEEAAEFIAEFSRKARALWPDVQDP